MKLSKSLLTAMMVAITTGAIISCEKPKINEGKKTVVPNSKTGINPSDTIPEGCPACGMG